MLYSKVILCTACFSHLSVVLNHVQVIKNPITAHLPAGCRKVGTSFSSDKLVDMEDYASDEPIVVVIGAMAHGKVCGVSGILRGGVLSHQWCAYFTVVSFKCCSNSLCSRLNVKSIHTTPLPCNAGRGGLHRRGSGHQ